MNERGEDLKEQEGQAKQPKQNDRLTMTEREKKKMLMALYIAGLAVIAVCISILFYFAVDRFDGLRSGIDTFTGILRPFVIGFVMAFLINPITNFLEKYLLPFVQRHSKNPKAAKFVRTVCSILGMLVFVGIIAIFLMVIIPEMYRTVMFLVNNISEQIMGVLDWANQITGGRFEENIMGVKESGIDEAIESGLVWVQETLNLEQDKLISMVVTGAYSIGKFLMDVIIAIIVSVYILCSKETFRGQTKKILYAVFPAKHANVILEVVRKANSIFYGFIIGKIVDSLIIGIICYVSMLILRMPYPILVSVIIGLTNIIPVFGPYIGAVPTVIIIFLTSPMQGIYFLIFVLVLQQVDGNIIGPKILGDTTGLSAFWVVFAIVVGGGLFGFGGMIIGVPTMALIYYLAGRLVKYMLRRRQLPECTEDYVALKSVDTVSHTIEELDEEDMSPRKKRPFSGSRRKSSQEKK